MFDWIQCHKIRRWRRSILLYLLGLSFLLFWINRERDFLIGQIMIHKALWTEYDKSNPDWRYIRARDLEYAFMRQKDFDTPTSRMLCPLLEYPEPEVRRAAASNLWERATFRKGIDCLFILKRYEHDPDPMVREYCLLARAYLGDQKALLLCAKEMNTTPYQTRSYRLYMIPIRDGLFREAGDSLAQHIQDEMSNHRYPHELFDDLYELMDRKAGYGKEFGEEEYENTLEDYETWPQLGELKKKDVAAKLLSAWPRIRPQCRSLADFRDGDIIRLYSDTKWIDRNDGWTILGIIAYLVASFWFFVYILLAFLCIRRGNTLGRFLQPARNPQKIP